MKTVLELLTEGRALLTPAEARTFGALARNAKGYPLLTPYDPDATCFCSIGAIHKVGGRETSNEVKRQAVNLLNAATKAHSSPHYTIVSFNDDRRVTHDQILAVWDKAVELCHARAA